MTVKAEVRDLRKIKKYRVKIVLPIFLWALFLIGTLYMISSDIHWIFAALFFVGVFMLIPIFVIAFKNAQRLYEDSWIIQSFDFVALDHRLYLHDLKLHVNYDKELQRVYLHDLGDYKNPCKASFYASVKGEEVVALLEYLEKEKVPLEKEELPKGHGKFGMIVPLSISKYRRDL